MPECRNQYFYLARKVIFEAKAGQAEASDQYLREARASLVEPTPLWLALSIEAIRYRMTKATQEGYTELWIKDLKKKCKSETAGEMASLLDTFLSTDIEYPGRDGHIKEVVAYLQRTTRLKYRREDIEKVCEFLGHLPEETALLEKLVKHGLKSHPQSALLNFRAGPHRNGEGAFQHGRHAREILLRDGPQAGRGVDRAEGDRAAPPDQEVVDHAQRDEQARDVFPFFGEGPFSMPFDGLRRR